MCGIVGVLTKTPTNKTRNAFKMMHFFDRLRGEHSSGIIGVNRDYNTAWYKKAIATPDFYHLPVADRIVSDASNILLIGHNRHATMGKVNDANAHPFQRGSLIGVHNGTLTSRWDLKDYTKIDVDSDNIYHHMEDNGIDDTISRLRGAFALVWVDEEAKTLHMIRNSERPLVLIPAKDGSALFFASEPWMIQIACRRAGIELGQVQDLNVGVLVTVDLEEFPNDLSVTTRKLELYSPKYAPSAVSYGNASSANSSNVKRTPATTQRTSGSGESAEDKPIYYQNGEEISIIFDRLERTYMRNINDYICFAHGVTPNGKLASIIISEEMYEVLKTRTSQLNMVKAGFCHYYIDGKNRKNSSIIYVADGRTKVKTTFKDGTVSVYEDQFPSQEDNDIPFDDSDNLLEFTVKGFEGRVITAKKFAELTNCGCAACADAVDIKDAEDIEWLSHEAFLCKHCSDLKQGGSLKL